MHWPPLPPGNIPGTQSLWLHKTPKYPRRLTRQLEYKLMQDTGAVAYQGRWGFGGFDTPSPKFWSFDKAELNSQFRGKYIHNNLLRIQVSLICKLTRTPNKGATAPRSPFSLSSTEFVESLSNKIHGYATAQEWLVMAEGQVHTWQDAGKGHGDGMNVVKRAKPKPGFKLSWFIQKPYLIMSWTF
jgi:hypothetical protein